MGKYLFFCIFLMLFLPFTTWPEGTKQVAPIPGATGQLCIDKSRNSFGFFDAPPEFRLNIRIADISEKISFGLGRLTVSLVPPPVTYQLKDPNGIIVVGPDTVPASGKGFINSYDAALSGPFVLAGGYDPIQYIPLLTGDYFLEFNYKPDSLTYREKARVQFEFFDITVVNAAGQPISGRVWSKAWQLNCGNVLEPPNRFWGTMFILSDDSIVTSVNCNGLIGGTFSVSSNKTGCSITGNIDTDRQSRLGFHTYPQYKVFLADPDSIVFPTGKAQPGIILPILTTSHCETGSVDIDVKVDQDGLIEVFIEIDPNPGADPQDVKLTANVFAHPGGNGYNTIRWNGKNGQGADVRNGKFVNATIKFIHGITHLPIFDIEYNNHGYKVNVIRPPGISPPIYWDDSLIPDGNSVNLSGCIDTTGCHLWDFYAGDNNTINSWWYVASGTAPVFSFMVRRTPGNPGVISGEPNHCAAAISRSYSVMPDPDVTAYTWNYTGMNTILAGTGPSITLGFSEDATSGLLSVSGSNAECGSGPSSSLPLSVFPLPAVSVSMQDSICLNSPVIRLAGGLPPGGEYYLDGALQGDFDPYISGLGSHTLVYRYTDANGCFSSDTAGCVVKDGPDCKVVMWVPNAFTPNADRLNDTFRPVTENIWAFSMNIYDRTGELLFTTSDPDAGWDGTFRGEACPVGNYIYVIVYQSSRSEMHNKTISGNLILVR